MTAAALIEQADADGLKLWPNGGRMAYEGPPAVVERWKPILAANKPSILAELNARSPVDREASPSAENTPTASRWWLIRYPDRDPVEVACFPPATHAEILERHTEAIAAEPINQAAPEPAHKSCSTCTHVTGRGGCGEPAAGLSDVTGVIRYNPVGGDGCPAWQSKRVEA
ncbi:MAG: hypothetical protein KKG92_02615 [Gammaproteobacteria bacterium]|nr:hypothetical protein [Gammaproteobacteria bacterium]